MAQTHCAGVRPIAANRRSRNQVFWKDNMRIIDGDGHVIEVTPESNIADFLPHPYREARRFSIVGAVFPPLDHLHNEPVQLPSGSGDMSVGPTKWKQFLIDTGIESTVLYPTVGLSIGWVASRDWACALCTAYNNWLHKTYLSASPSFKGMALLPLQDPQAAVMELRRAVTELGMLGAMLPSNGLKGHLGAKEYWPVYEEANRLGCALAVHGASAARLGLDHLDVRPATHALAHPFALLISCAGIVFNGIFDKYPNIRIAFLEGGIAWLLVAMERFDRSYHTHIPFNPRGELLQLKEGTRIQDYIRRLMEERRFMVGCEGEEPDIGYAVRRFGNKGFMFSSDFPHEVNTEMCKREIGEILEHTELSDQDRQFILCRNAEQFYRID